MTKEGKPMGLLALLSRGIWAFADLVVLDKLMNRITCDIEPYGNPLPMHVFDFVVGSPTGGDFSAVQLGHLGQTVSEAKKAYAGIVAESVSFPRDSEKTKFDPRKLEESVGMLLERTCSRGRQRLPSGKGNCHINTAVRSTAQQPTKTGHHEADLINHILDEAVRLFPEREIACLVCIGTDGAPFTDAAKGSLADAYAPVEAIGDAHKYLTAKAAMVLKRLQADGLYFRFAFDDYGVLQNIAAGEWEKQVCLFANEYLRQHDISQHLDEAAAVLKRAL